MDTDQAPGHIEQWLIGECAGRLAQALEAMTVQSCQVVWLAGAPAPAEPLAWWRQPLSLAPGAEIWVGAADQAWSAVGRQALEAAGIDDAEVSDLKSTYHEIVTQALSGTAQAIGARLGREVVCQPGTESEEAPGGAAGWVVEIRFAGGETARVVLKFGSALPEQLESREQKAVEAAPSPAAAAREAPPPEGAKTLDLLLEVELPVSVSFGRAQLPLKDVLKLTSGSIVEMNRAVTEPVEVIVNNCVIARGEVVVVGGNYGIRIQQIVSRQERLRSLY
jgi:flagellar motor switch protein FliN/FliY